MPTPFTLDHINRAHKGVSQHTVRDYLEKLRALGVVSYTTYIIDGHSDYFDAKGDKLSSAPVHEPYPVTDEQDAEAARQAIDAHGAGETDYFAFSKALAAAAVESWVMDPVAMTLSYRSRTGQAMIVEAL